MTIKNKAVVLGVGLLLSSNVVAKADDVDIDLSRLDNGNIIFCSSCKLKLPEELKLKKYPYSVDHDFVYDGTNNFIGLRKVDLALRNAGITNYKIDVKPNPGETSLYFDVKTDNTNKNYLALVLNHIEGLSVEEDMDALTSESIDKVRSTDGYASCYRRAHAGALQKLKAFYDDNKYNYDYRETADGTSSRYLNDETFEVRVCLYADEVEKKEDEE